MRLPFHTRFRGRRGIRSCRARTPRNRPDKRRAPLRGPPDRQPAGKRASVPLSKERGRPSIWDRRRRRPRAAYPNARRSFRSASGGPPENAPCLTLLRTGFAEPRRSPAALVGSYPTVSPLPAPPAEPGIRSAHVCGRWRSVLCGTFPASPRVGVTHRPALRRPDFPRPGSPGRGRLAGYQRHSSPRWAEGAGFSPQAPLRVRTRSHRLGAWLGPAA
jgi:hypothetical protein